MDTAVRFYTDTLGMKLTNRFGDHWATAQAGSFVIGLHPVSARYPAPGTPGSIVLGLEIDEPITDVVSRLTNKGVKLAGGIIEDASGKFVDLEDPDGNRIYLWEVRRWGAPQKGSGDVKAESRSRA